MLGKLSWVMVGTLLGMVAIAQPARAQLGLSGYYEFDDAGNLGLDTSGNGNDATNGGATFTPSGLDGGAASFDGIDDFLNVPIDVSIGTRPQLTWGAFVQATDPTSVQAVLSADDGGFDRNLNIDSRMGFGAPAGSVEFSAFTGGNGVFRSGVTPPTAPTAFVFLAATYDESDSTLTFFVDDQSFSTTTNFGSSSQSSFDIGRNPLSSGVEFFTGTIDNVFVFDRALSEAEVETIRTNGGVSVVPFEFESGAGLALLAAGYGALKFRNRAKATR